MCWFSNIPVNCITAKDDIKVYKIFKKNVKGQLISPIYDFKWEIGKLYVENDIPNCPSSVINKGFHSLKTIPICRFGYWWNTLYRNLPLLTDRGHFVCVCEIPKGSLCYINECDEIVSNKLKIIECVKS